MLSKKWPIGRWEDHGPSRRDNQLLYAVSVLKPLPAERSAAEHFLLREASKMTEGWTLMGYQIFLNSIFHFKCGSKSNAYRMRAKSFSSNQQGHHWYLHGKLSDKNTLDFQPSKRLVIPFTEMTSWWPKITLAVSAEWNFSNVSIPGCAEKL